jgi:hypothetical protein
MGLVYELTNIHDLRVLHNELVHGNGGDPEEDAGENHGDNSWNPSQDAEEISTLMLRKLGLRRVQAYESDHVCAIIARQTWSPASSHAAFCHDMVRSLISCW